MGKKLLAAVITGSLFFTFTAGYTCAEKTVSALSIIATVKNVSVEKDVIAVGESVQLEFEWSTGAKQELFFTSNDESVATVDQDGIVTGIGNGTAEITVSHSNYGSDKTITITVSENVRESVCYNTSELTLGTKLYKYDKLHYDGKNIGMGINIVNDKGGYDLAWPSEEDYILPFDAELVGIDGLTIYLAPELENVKYIDGRTLSVGDVIDTSSHLLCYDYHINKCVFPVFLPEYYEKYIGEGEIRVKDIDHENKTITLEAVEEKTEIDTLLTDFNALLNAQIVTVSDNRALVVFHPMVQQNGCVIEADKMEWGVYGTADTGFVTETLPYDENEAVAYCLITADSPGTVCVKGKEITQYGTGIEFYVYMTVDENGNFNPDYVLLGEPEQGDVNADSTFSVADVVEFQKWLSAPDTHGAYLDTADFNSDGRLDVFDLCLMKRKLINTVSEDI